MRFRALWRHLLNGAQILGQALTFPITEVQGGTNQTTYAKGDVLYASGVNTLAKLGIGNYGQILMVNASGVPAWRDIISLADMFWFYDDFVNFTNLWAPPDTSGTGANVLVRAAGSDITHPGVAEFHTGTTTTGRANLYQTNQDDEFPLPSNTTYEAIFKLGALSNGTDTFDMQFGWSHGPYTNPLVALDGIWVSHDSGTNGGNLTLNCSSSSTATTSDMGTAPTAGAFMRVGWILNAARTSVQGTINGVAAGSPITTNIPGTSPKGMLYNFMKKSAGTTDCLMYLDAVKIISMVAR